jgi:hypothetical protein
MRILAIDPGNEQSAFVTIDGGVPLHPEKWPNAEVLKSLKFAGPRPLLAVEMIASYGMAVGREVFETCLWIGRFLEAWKDRGGVTRLVYRRDVKLFLCQSARANDSNIRAALIDKYGPGKARAVGTKKAQGPLYALKGDTWSALAVALTAEEQVRIERPWGVVESAKPEQPLLISDPINAAQTASTQRSIP